MAAANREIARIETQLAKEYRENDGDLTAFARPLRDQYVGAGAAGTRGDVRRHAARAARRVRQRRRHSARARRCARTGDRRARRARRGAHAHLAPAAHRERDARARRRTRGIVRRRARQRVRDARGDRQRSGWLAASIDLRVLVLRSRPRRSPASFSASRRRCASRAPIPPTHCAAVRASASRGRACSRRSSSHRSRCRSCSPCSRRCRFRACTAWNRWISASIERTF